MAEKATTPPTTSASDSQETMMKSSSPSCLSRNERWMDDDSNPTSGQQQQQQSRSNNNNNQRRRRRVFISFDPQDIEYRDRLVVQLHHIRDRGYIDSWSDETTLVGSTSSLSTTTSSTTSIHHLLQNAMEGSNLFLFLISPNFIASKSIRQNQVPYATYRTKVEKTAQIISIIIRSVHWSELTNSIKSISTKALPSNLRPIKRWGDDQDEAWLDVEKGIIEVIQILQQKEEVEEEVDLSSDVVDAVDVSSMMISSGGNKHQQPGGVRLKRMEGSIRLDSISQQPQPQQQGGEGCKVFISYTQQDVHHRDRLDVQLHHLQECGYIHSWLDQKIVLRNTNTNNKSTTTTTIQEAMEVSNLFLLLISPDFMANESILKHEVPYITQRTNEGTAKVISIIIRSVNWFELPTLNRFQALPSDLYPIQKWNDQDEAWLNVEKGIINAIRIGFRGESSTNIVWDYTTSTSTSSTRSLPVLLPPPPGPVSPGDHHGTPAAATAATAATATASGGESAASFLSGNSGAPNSNSSEAFRTGHMEGYQGGSIGQGLLLRDHEEDDDDDHQQNDDKKCKVFISYSHNDPQYRDRLEVQLKHLHDRGFIDCWSDNQILPSMDWHSSILSAMESADVFLLLVSPDFLASTFIMEEEVPYATKRAEEGTAQVVAIVARSVHWSELPTLSRFQAFPSNLRPIKRWEDQDEAWLDVEKGVIQAIRVFTGDVIDTFATMASPALRAMRAFQSSSSSSSLFEDGSDLGSSTTSSSRFVTALRNKDPPLHFHRITDFWRTQDIQEGRRISLHCTLSRYAPMAIGSPYKKRDAHLAFRKLMSDPNKKMNHMDEAKLNSLLSFTAGQMAWSIEFQELPWQFLGLYQSIIRNSIPLFVHQDYYRSYVEQLFVTSGKTFDARVVGRVIRLPEDFSALFADNKLIGTNIVKPKIFDEQDARPIYGLLVDPSEDESTGISVREPATYLDGDIWVAIQTNDEKGIGSCSKTSIHTRFCNLADERDIADSIRDLKDELEQKYPQGYTVVFQFDQLEKRFEGKQKLDAEDMFGIVFE